MSSVPPVQDMPPPGGYSKINYQRVPAKVMFTGIKLFGAFAIMQSLAVYLRLTYTETDMRRNELELRSSILAVIPFYEAENDRAALLQLRKNREEEEKLMKNVDGWVVGTWMGEPVYKSKGVDEWVEPKVFEYYSHSNQDDFQQLLNCHLRR